MRVQIPAYTDRWMRGDRYGDVTKVAKGPVMTKRGPIEQREIAHVKLDVSGKTMKFVLDDCTVVS